MKDILVSIDATTGFETSIEAALRLAETFDSYILCVHEVKYYTYSSYAEVYSDVIAAAFEKQQAQDRKSITRLFSECTKSSIDKCTLKFEEPFGQTNLLTYANVSDIVVCQQHNGDESIFGDRNLPEHLVMNTGKPVLIVPYIGLRETMGRNVIVAWDGSREASRAIHDALPLLKRAEQVRIFSAMDTKKGEAELATTDLASHLARHDVNVDTNPDVVTDVPVAEMLLSRASDFDADLMVMGAYGHSRLREYTLGGTTRTILNSMTIPVLMTH